MDTSIRRLLLGAACIGLPVLAACDSKSIAYGDENSIIAVMDPALWEELSDEVLEALEPTVRTVRDEKRFTVTYQDPGDEFWGDLRRFRQMLVVGTAEQPWVADVLEEARNPITSPGLHQVEDVWSRGQTVTLVLLSDAMAGDEVRSRLLEIQSLLDDQYREWVRRRMYMSGVDSALADTLSVEARFTLMLPRVYDWEQFDSTYVFRNDQPDPSELIRQVAVTWRTPVPRDMQPEGILAWRAEVARTYNEPQDVELADADARAFDYRGLYAYEIQAAWKNPPDRGWPAGGPFITRAVICESQNRMYLLDAWLYAPGKEKYEYMIQLQNVLDSFRCGSG